MSYHVQQFRLWDHDNAPQVNKKLDLKRRASQVRRDAVNNLEQPVIAGCLVVEQKDMAK
jgi:hypothetical protein